MSSSRKVIGILLLLPMPLVLLGIIWSSGLSRVITQPTKLSQISTNALEQLPAFADRTLILASQSAQLKNEKARQWLQAIRKAGITPSKLWRDIGIAAWARQESDNIIGELQKLMEGEPLSREITLDVSGLKDALGAEKLDYTWKRLMSHLPRCTLAGLQGWQQLQIASSRRKQLPPACHPGGTVMPSLLRAKQLAVYQMPASIDLLPQLHKGHFLYTWITAFSHIPWLLFLFPGCLIMIGAAIGGHGMRGFCQWSGAVTLLGGLLALPTPFLLKDVLLKAYLLEPWRASLQADLPISPKVLHPWLFEHVLPLFRNLTAPLFSSVETVSLIVCVAGIGLLGLGAAFSPREQE